MTDHGETRVVCGYDDGRPCSIQTLNFFIGCHLFTEGPTAPVSQDRPYDRCVTVKLATF